MSLLFVLNINVGVVTCMVLKKAQTCMGLELKPSNKPIICLT